MISLGQSVLPFKLLLDFVYLFAMFSVEKVVYGPKVPQSDKIKSFDLAAELFLA